MTTTEGAPTLVIVGAGGFGREVLQYAWDAFGPDSPQPYDVKGFLDDRVRDLSAFGIDVPVLGRVDDHQPTPDERFLIAVGDPTLRETLSGKLAERGARFAVLVHPLAFVARTATIGEGCIVAPFATIGAHATLGAHSVLTYYASVGHDARVGRWCALSPHSVANGASTIGDRAFLGAHAVVNPLQSVGDDAKVAAGAVVYGPVPPKTLAAGNPAKARPTW